VIRDKRRVKATGGGPQQAPGTGQPASAQPEGPTPASGGEGGAPGAAPEQPDTAPPPAAETGRPGGTEAPAAGDAQPTAAAPAGGEPAAPAAETEPAGLGAELEALRAALDERTRDLQRVTAEYANYRKRVERDRARVGEQATANVLSALLPVLDDLDRAREHGELVDGFAAVAEQLISALTKFGLTAFGEKGDPFDPNRHEAVAHLTSDEVNGPTCIDILRRGYLLGDRLLRPAMVAVADPPSDES